MVTSRRAPLHTTVPPWLPAVLRWPIARAITYARRYAPPLTPPLELAGRVSAIGLVLVTVAAWVFSARWGFRHDGPVVMYAAHLARTGQHVPYTQIFDMNQPGTFLLMGIVDALFGPDDFALRMVDIALLATTCLLTPAALRMPRALPGIAGSFAYALFHLRAIGADALQREVWVLAVAFAGGACLRWRAPVWSGVLAGLLIFVKVHAFAFPLLFLLGHLERATRVRTLVRWSAGVAITVAAMVAALHAIGALEAWWWITRNYLPLYAQMAGRLCFEPDPVAGWLERARLLHDVEHAPLLPYIPFAAWLALRTRAGSPWERTTWMALGLVVVGWLYPAIGGNFWTYQHTPGWLSVGILVALTLTVPRRAMAAPWVERGAILYLLLPMAHASLHPYVDDARANRLGAGRNTVAQYVERFLSEHLEPGDTVQPFETVTGAVDGMWRADAPLATSFAYGFYFYQSRDNPVILGMRERFMRELDQTRPRYFLRAAGAQWLCGGPHTTESFPELDIFVAHHYRRVDGVPGAMDILERREPWE